MLEHIEEYAWGNFRNMPGKTLGKLGHIEQIFRNMPGEMLGIFRTVKTYLGICLGKG